MGTRAPSTRVYLSSVTEKRYSIRFPYRAPQSARDILSQGFLSWGPETCSADTSWGKINRSRTTVG